MGSEFSRKRKPVRILVLGRRKLLFTIGVVIFAAACMLYIRQERIAAVSGSVPGERTVHMVTGEFESTLPDGKEIEVYRWDPGTVYVRKGEQIKLSITGVNGESHPFIIEGLGLKGEVKKGEETVVSFKADKPGIYRIICLIHPDFAHGGPMIGYIVVD